MAHHETAGAEKPRRAFFVLRVILALVLMALLLAGVYLWCYRSYPAVAEWEKAGSHDALIFEGETYRCIGEIGKRGLTLKKYPIGEQIGRVRDDGTPVETEAPTLPPDAESGETVKRPTPDGTPTLGQDHAYVLYSVKDLDNMLLMLDKNGEYYLYYREIAEWSSPADHTSLTYQGRTYIRAGVIGTGGYSAKNYAEDMTLGLVRNDGLAPKDESDGAAAPESDTLWPMPDQPEKEIDYAAHHYVMTSVADHPAYLIVKEADGKQYLYYREGSIPPQA